MVLVSKKPLLGTAFFARFARIAPASHHIGTKYRRASFVELLMQSLGHGDQFKAFCLQALAHLADIIEDHGSTIARVLPPLLRCHNGRHIGHICYGGA